MDVAVMCKNEQVSFSSFNRFFNGAMSVLTQSIYLQGLEIGFEDQNEEDPLFNKSFSKIFSSFCHQMGFNQTQFFYQLKNAMKDYYMINTLDEILEKDEKILVKTDFLIRNPLYQLVKRIQNYIKFRTLVNEANKLHCSILKFDELDNDVVQCYEAVNKQIEIVAKLVKIHLKVSPLKFCNLPSTLIPDNKFEEIIIPATIKRTNLEILKRFEQIRLILRMQKMVPIFMKMNFYDIDNTKIWLAKYCSLVLACLEKFVDDFGHRGFKEMDMLNSTWSSDIPIVLKALQLYLENSKQKIDRILNRDSLFGFLNNIFDKTPYEVTKSTLASAVHNLRLSYLNLAELLVLQGKLPNKKLIFHLTHHEIGVLLNKGNPQLITKAIKRKELFEEWDSSQVKNINFNHDTLPKIEADKSDDKIKLLGTSVVPGNITGRVCVIRSKEDFYKLNYGDIVFTKYTDFGWTIFLQSVSGIVIESSEIFSEGPVLAEYYNIPCIVGVENVTEYFKTGDNILLTIENDNLGAVLKI